MQLRKNKKSTSWHKPYGPNKPMWRVRMPTDQVRCPSVQNVKHPQCELQPIIFMFILPPITAHIENPSPQLTTYFPTRTACTITICDSLYVQCIIQIPSRNWINCKHCFIPEILSIFELLLEKYYLNHEQTKDSEGAHTHGSLDLHNELRV